MLALRFRSSHHEYQHPENHDQDLAESRRREVVSNPRRMGQGELALRFFGLSLVLWMAGGMLAFALLSLLPVQSTANRLPPVPFFFSTLALIFVSLFLHRAVRWVRIEKQRPFRRSLVWAMISSTLFLGVQSYALSGMARQVDPAEAELAASPFVIVFAGLHALHALVATLFLAFVTVRAESGRYDHEYYWGIRVCGWLWHALLVVWMAILMAALIAGGTGKLEVSSRKTSPSLDQHACAIC